MYYFEILEILENAEDKLSANEIYFELSIKIKHASIKRMYSVLLDMFIKNDKVNRDIRLSDTKTRTPEYVYFIEN